GAWWAVGATGVGSPEEAGQGSAAVLACGIGEAVGPLAQECFDQRLGLAVRLRPVGTREAAPDAVAGADEPPRARAVGAGIVGEYALDHDSLLAIPPECPQEEGCAR